MSDEIKLFSIIPNSTKEEVLNPASNLIGQAFRGIAHKLLDPLVRYNIVKDAEINAFANNVRNKTDSVPIENRDASKLGLTYKAVEDSVYQLNAKELREMFSNLISATVDNRKNNYVKPSFSSILKDISPEDAKLFRFIFVNDAIPLVSVRVYNKENLNGFDILENVILLNEDEIQEQSSLNILQRFGLINFIPDFILQKHADLYNDFKNRKVYIDIKEKLPLKADSGITLDSIEIKKSCVKLTALGNEFGEIVISQ